jgi:DNA-binding transcriptional LysR family regulator
MLDGVTINQLRTFVAVCEEASFSGAARKLRRAQSAISHAVAALEDALGVELFERSSRRPQLSAAGRSLLSDARAVIARTEEMKARATSIAEVGAPVLSIAIDVYFPRWRLIHCLQEMQRLAPNAVVNLRMTTMQSGEKLVLDDACALAITIADVPELNASAIERHVLCQTPMITVCAPSHALAKAETPVFLDQFSRHVQIVVTDNQAGTSKQMAVAGERQWLVNDLSAKLDLLRAGLGWGHMPVDLVSDDLARGSLIEIERRAWHMAPLTFVVSRRRGRELSASETQLIGLLGENNVAGAKPPGRRPRKTKLKRRRSNR